MPVGHKQFTEIARELSKDHLKLPDPGWALAVLTEKEAEALLSAIRGMAQGDIAVIFITHRLHEICTVCDRVCVMRDGKLVQNVPAKDTDVLSHSVDGGQGKERASPEGGERQECNARRHLTCLPILWVDIPGEAVRDVTLEGEGGEILGISPAWPDRGSSGSRTGSGGLYQAGGKVVFNGEEIPLDSPRKCLDSSFAFVSERLRGVGLLLDESLEWNIAFPAVQIQNKFLKNYLGGLIKWRDDAAIRRSLEIH